MIFMCFVFGLGELKLGKAYYCFEKIVVIRGSDLKLCVLFNFCFVVIRLINLNQI